MLSSEPPAPDLREPQQLGKIKWVEAFEPMPALGATQKITLSPGHPVTLLIGVDNRIEQADVATDPYLDFLPRARRYANTYFNCTVAVTA